ncbi:MAG: undecaprenyl-diphosphatase [Tolumonas sp.]|nr:undecaprenyl-diphosphatase [Tolumonas sp.]
MYLLLQWFRSDLNVRRDLFNATMCAFFALIVNQVISFFWMHPRPFVIGLGHTFIPHVADSSFPSDHMTLMCAVGFSFLFSVTQQAAGKVFLSLSLFVAWARIYLGVHYPVDILGAIVLTAIWAMLVNKKLNGVMIVIFRKFMMLYQFIFSTTIHRGWMK